MQTRDAIPKVINGILLKLSGEIPSVENSVRLFRFDYYDYFLF